MAWNIGPSGGGPLTNFTIFGEGTTVTHVYWWDGSPLGVGTQMAFASPPTIATLSTGVETVSNGIQMLDGQGLRYTVTVRGLGTEGGAYRLGGGTPA